MPGPLPKRSDQRRRRNVTDVDRAPAAVRVSVPAPDKTWHPIARRWYLALRRSGQSVFYEPSDWAHALFVADAMSRCLQADRISANLFASVDTASTRLLVTEGDRRRLRLELDRATADEDADSAEASVTELRSVLGG